MTPIQIKTISDFHRLVGLPPPEHPLISVIDYSKIKNSAENNQIPVVFSFTQFRLTEIWILKCFTDNRNMILMKV